LEKNRRSYVPIILYAIIGGLVYGEHINNLIALVKAENLEYCIWRTLTIDLVGINFLAVFIGIIGLFIKSDARLEWKVLKFTFSLVAIAIISINIIDYFELLRYQFLYRTTCV
jgi:hypothetical protein